MDRCNNNICWKNLCQTCAYACCEPSDEALPVSIDEMISSVYHDLRSPKLTSFSLSAPHPSLLPSAKLNKSVMHSLRNSPDHCLNYEHIQGNESLRKQIARLSFNWGGTLSEDDVVITAGCKEALSFCLRAITKPGDAVATESPTFYGIFRVMQSLGLKVVEVPTDPVTGVDINYLAQAIPRFNIKACLFVCNFNNPIGSCVPDDKKKELVVMLARKEIPLIEDDIYVKCILERVALKPARRLIRRDWCCNADHFQNHLRPDIVLAGRHPVDLKMKSFN